jgi:hypothetical protein
MIRTSKIENWPSQHPSRKEMRSKPALKNVKSSWKGGGEGEKSRYDLLQRELKLYDCPDITNFYQCLGRFLMSNT